MSFSLSSYHVKRLWPILMVLVALPAVSQPRSTGGSVCSTLNLKCDSPHKKFAPYELLFRLPRTIKDNTPYYSVPFYAVVLKRFTTGTATECDGGEWTILVEKERLRLQKLFPQQKVFASHQCPDMSALSYTMNGKIDNGVFITVYAGSSQSDANKLLPLARRVSTQAKIYRMRAAFERIMQ